MEGFVKIASTLLYQKDRTEDGPEKRKREAEEEPERKKRKGDEQPAKIVTTLPLPDEKLTMDGLLRQKLQNFVNFLSTLDIIKTNPVFVSLLSQFLKNEEDLHVFKGFFVSNIRKDLEEDSYKTTTEVLRTHGLLPGDFKKEEFTKIELYLNCFNKLIHPQ